MGSKEMFAVARDAKDSQPTHATLSLLTLLPGKHRKHPGGRVSSLSCIATGEV
jgi:hypothetical protein